MGASLTDRDTGWEKFFANARAIGNGAHVKVGVLDEGLGAEQEEGSNLTVAEIAAIQEFGTQDGRIPERSFIRSTFDEQRSSLLNLSREFVGQIYDGRMGVEQALGLLGARLAADMKAKITGGLSPPNAPSTMLRKAMTGRTAKFFKHSARNLGGALAQVGALAAVKPLIDTGRLLGALTWSVVMGRE